MTDAIHDFVSNLVLILPPLAVISLGLGAVLALAAYMTGITDFRPPPPARHLRVVEEELVEEEPYDWAMPWNMDLVEP